MVGRTLDGKAFAWPRRIEPGHGDGAGRRVPEVKDPAGVLLRQEDDIGRRRNQDDAAVGQKAAVVPPRIFLDRGYPVLGHHRGEVRTGDQGGPVVSRREPGDVGGFAVAPDVQHFQGAGPPDEELAADGLDQHRTVASDRQSVDSGFNQVLLDDLGDSTPESPQILVPGRVEIVQGVPGDRGTQAMVTCRLHVVLGNDPPRAHGGQPGIRRDGVAVAVGEADHPGIVIPADGIGDGALALLDPPDPVVRHRQSTFAVQGGDVPAAPESPDRPVLPFQT